MIEETWKETAHNHALGYSFERHKSRQIVAPGALVNRPYQLGMACTAHKRDLTWVPIEGKFSAAHVCDDRCMNAIGAKCECSCGGANHGRGYHVELKFNTAQPAQMQLV